MDEAERPADWAPVRYTATWRQRATSLTGLGVWGALLVLTHGGPGWTFRVTVVALVALIIGLGYWWSGVTLTPEALVLRRPWRRTIPWSRISDVRVVRGNESWIAVFDTRGRRVRLNWPRDGFLFPDRHFTAKSVVVHRWWLRYGDAVADRPLTPVTPPTTWGPRPRPDSALLRPGQPQGFVTAVVSALLALEIVDGLIAPDYATGIGPSGAELALGSLAVLVVLAVLGRYVLARGTGLTRDGVVVRRWLTRNLAWSEVASVDVERSGGERRRVVLRRRDGGRPVALPVPRIGVLLWDRDFEAKYATITAWWERHRADDPAPADPPPHRVPYPGPRLWQRVAVGFVVVTALYLAAAAIVTSAVVTAGGAG